MAKRTAARSVRKKSARKKPASKPTQRTARTPEDVAKRAIILKALYSSGHNEKRQEIVKWLKSEGLWDAVTPWESKFMSAKKLPKSDTPVATWRIEAVFPMLWALHLVPKFPRPIEFGGITKRPPVPFLKPTAEFIKSATLRPQHDVEAAHMDVEHSHWRIRDAAINGKKPPRGIDPEVILEQHHAMNWLAFKDEDDWDNIATDT